MSTSQINRAIWLIELLRRYPRLTREEINDHWRNSNYSDGSDIPRQSFIKIKEDINQIFNITIECDTTTYEYFIPADTHRQNITDWMMHTHMLSDALVDSQQVADLIFLEDVPSARHYLGILVNSLRERHPVKFDYTPYTRTTPTRNVILHPYFLKLFKQRWYVTSGVASEGGPIKTYALDRMLKPSLLEETYKIPADFDAELYFRDSFGIVFTHGEVKDIKLKVTPRQAKYFRALPLHHSQQEIISDSYSIFSFRMKISPDFVSEILSHGPDIEVLEPRELRAMVIESLRSTLATYNRRKSEKP